MSGAGLVPTAWEIAKQAESAWRNDPLPRRCEDLKLGDGPGVPRRGHPRHHQGAAAVGRGLRRRLPGRADLAPDGRAGRRPGHPVRSSACSSRASASEAAAAATLAASVMYPIRGAVTFKSTGRHQRGVRRAVQPGVGRRHRRRPDHRRRGLRRGLLDHAGAQPRLRDEVADLAARSAAQPGMHRQRGRGRLRAVGGLQHAGHAGGAHPRLPRARQLHAPRTTSGRR